MKTQLEFSQRPLFVAAVLLFLIKFVIMAIFPVLGDEAYYIYWGMHPAAGYYDLPPMVGWWLAPFVKLSVSPFWLRLPNLVAQVLIAFGVFEWLKSFVDQSRASLIAAILFFLPFPFFSVVMFPDIPLLFFAFFSSFLFFRAVKEKKPSAGWSYFFSGVLFGAAFLSKYFAVLLIPAFGIWFLTEKSRNWFGLFLFTWGSLPFLYEHIHWNQDHCWANFVFNLITRQQVNDGPWLQIVGLFIVYLLVLSTPFLWGAFRARLTVPLDRGLERASYFVSLHRFTLFLWLIPTGMCAVSALMGKGQGMHWLLFVLPFFVIWATLKIEDLRRTLKHMMTASGVIAIVGIVVLTFPDTFLGQFFETRFAFEYKLITHPRDFVENILPEVRETEAVFTEGYTLSSLLQYDFKAFENSTGKHMPPVSVWAAGSRFGRVFDWTINFRDYDGKNLLIVTPGYFNKNAWTQYFNSIDTYSRDFMGRPFFIAVGRGFKAEHYLNEEFRKTVTKYYPPFAPGVCSIRK